MRLLSNPVTGRIEYKINTSKGGKTEISLMNISGQKFIQQSMLLNEGENNYSIDVAGYRPGMYIEYYR
ncbi:MAG: T9SS type A sorting domain-containing protein [Saprospiraceae bacterium]|nr:T9SS type A sorting domain-containing protein [Saprospiraceae bacterium]